MRILAKDLKKNFVKVQAFTLDDLWVIYNVVARGDHAYAKTTREIKAEGVGRPSSRRITVFMGLNVEKVHFDSEMSKLRLLGTVIEAPEEVHAKGSHHTITVGIDDQLTIVKEEWQRHQLERLDKATAPQKPLTVVSLDSEECCIAVLRSFGLEVKSELRPNLPGKMESEKREEATKAYFAEVGKCLQPLDPSPTIIVGPGFVKENLARHFRNSSPDLAARIASVAAVSHGGIAGVYESIRTGIVGKVMRDSRAAEETSLVGGVLKRLGAGTGDVAYGVAEVEEDAAAGAVDGLLVCDELLRESLEVVRKRIEEIMRTAESRGGKLTIVSSRHEGGRQLMSLGGIAAILRYQRHRAA